VRVVYRDEAFSAYKGSRGPDLAKALEHAERLAREKGDAVVVTSKADRLARGDGRDGKHLVEYIFPARRAGYRFTSVVDPSAFMNVAMAGIVGDQSHADSDGKGKSFARAHRNRWQPAASSASSIVWNTVSRTILSSRKVQT
jgi:DNA invertase Pin-like site-specific DNA recombinase